MSLFPTGADEMISGKPATSGIRSKRRLHARGTMFEVWFEVGWFDCDANRHLKNTAFLEYAIEARFRYFNEHGFPASAFAKHQIGPVVVRDEISYKRELHLLEKFKVQFL